jgi:hypothetical protein
MMIRSLFTAIALSSAASLLASDPAPALAGGFTGQLAHAQYRVEAEGIEIQSQLGRVSLDWLGGSRDAAVYLMDASGMYLPVSQETSRHLGPVVYEHRYENMDWVVFPAAVNAEGRETIRCQWNIYPAARPGQLALRLPEGAAAEALEGRIVLSTAAGRIELNRLQAWQQNPAGLSEARSVNFRLEGNVLYLQPGSHELAQVLSLSFEIELAEDLSGAARLWGASR